MQLVKIKRANGNKLTAEVTNHPLEHWSRLFRVDLNIAELSVINSFGLSIYHVAQPGRYYLCTK